MEQRRVGRSGLLVSRLGLGTGGWGREVDVDEAARQVRAFRDAGGTLLDTADGYGDGAAESVLGQLLTSEIHRDEVVIATKAGAAGGSAAIDCSRGALLRALDGSLRRLGIDHIDLWQVHHWDAATPLDETLAVLDCAVSSGRVRYVGVSNFTGWQTAAAATWQRAWPGRTPLTSTQVELSLVQRGIEREVQPAALAAGMGLLAWSPLGRGVLTGKYRRATPAGSRAVTAESWVAPYLDERSRRVVDAVATAAEGLGVSAVALALAWVRDRPGVAAPIVGARTLSQLEVSLASERVTVPAEIVAALDEVSAPWRGYPEAGITTG